MEPAYSAAIRHWLLSVGSVNLIYGVTVLLLFVADRHSSMPGLGADLYGVLALPVPIIVSVWMLLFLNRRLALQGAALAAYKWLYCYASVFFLFFMYVSFLVGVNHSPSQEWLSTSLMFTIVPAIMSSIITPIVNAFAKAHPAQKLANS